MLRRFKDLRHFTIGATGGDIGTIDDVYFDDLSWTARRAASRAPCATKGGSKRPRAGARSRGRRGVALASTCPIARGYTLITHRSFTDLFELGAASGSGTDVARSRAHVDADPDASVTPRQQPPDVAEAPPLTQGRSPLTVMIVDDDAEWRATLKSSLDREGFRTVALARADWIVPAIELHNPDVVVLDVQLPGPASGLDVVDTLGRRWPELFTVVTTAFGGTATADTARRLGASAYIDKPFRISALVEVIRRVRPSAQG